MGKRRVGVARTEVNKPAQKPGPAATITDTLNQIATTVNIINSRLGTLLDPLVDTILSKEDAILEKGDAILEKEDQILMGLSVTQDALNQLLAKVAALQTEDQAVVQSLSSLVSHVEALQAAIGAAPADVSPQIVAAANNIQAEIATLTTAVQAAAVVPPTP
jgi:hypothetical protein